MMSTKSHWLIVGPGALGQLYAAKLALAGHPVTLWGRAGITPAQHYQFTNLAGEVQQWQTVNSSSPIERVLVVTKIFQSAQATQAVLARGKISPHCPIILMHNGLGAGENLSLLSTQQPLLLASSRHGALKESANSVRHTGDGGTQIGLLRGELPTKQQTELCNELSKVGGDCQWHEEILLPLWQKLIINSVINPLTARERVKNGALLQPEYQQEITQLCEEACLIANLEGFPLNSQDLLAQIKQVSMATAENRSSMLQDLKHQRPTEIDYINGYLLKQAQKHQVKIVAQETIFQQVKQLSPL